MGIHQRYENNSLLFMEVQEIIKWKIKRDQFVKNFIFLILKKKHESGKIVLDIILMKDLNMGLTLLAIL